MRPISAVALIAAASLASPVVAPGFSPAGPDPSLWSEQALEVGATGLPARYFQLIEAGSAEVEQALSAEPSPSLETLELKPGWRHFPYAILAPAVLYAKKNPANARYHDPKMLKLALRIGDLLAREDEAGRFEPRLDSDWDTYMWLEAYRLLMPQLGETRQARWRHAIIRNTAPLEHDARDRVDFPWYQSPYIGTSPNHYAQWAELLYVAGKTFGNSAWTQLGAEILHRFASHEQSSDGYWGEHSSSGPTTGYDHLTLTAIAVYYELSKDAAVPPALRRSLTFHENFTYPDGEPGEVINDRNRYWEVTPYGHLAFSLFPDGRRYAEFLTSFFSPHHLSMEALGRLAQDALYYHSGPLASIPQDRPTYTYRMSVPAGIRKTGDWVVCLSGLISTQAIRNQYYLDRQGNFSIFRRGVGLIITGANSKRQPELATFSEKLLGRTFHMPMSSRLEMGNEQDRLSLAYNTFFCDLYVPTPSEKEQSFTFDITGHGKQPEEATLNLQLCLKAGEVLETGNGTRIVLDAEHIELGPDQIGGWIRHHGWTLKVIPAARLAWPIYPYNPYANGPEKTLDHAVGRLWVPLVLGPGDGPFIRPHAQKISFTVEVEQ